MTTSIRHPLAELAASYLAVLREAWAHRHELAGPDRLADERAFLPAAIELQESPPHPAPRRAAIAICLLFCAATLWSVIGHVDVVATAQGRIVVNERTKTIQPLETSVVRQVFVQDGDKVRAGDLLVALDSTSTQADAHRIRQERRSALSELLRSRALLGALDTGAPPRLGPPADRPLGAEDLRGAELQLRSEWANISAKENQLKADRALRSAELGTARQLVTKLQTTLPLLVQREQDYLALVRQGFVTNHAGQDRTRERIEQERDLAMALARQQESAAALVEADSSLEAFRADAVRALRDREAQADLKVKQLDAESAKAEQRDALTRLTAPVSGTVQQLAVHTTGGVVTPAQVLLVLVPDDAQVLADVVLENRDIGFVHVGQEAEVKLETFPFTRFGTVPAVVRSVSADAINDEKRGAIFTVTLLLKNREIEVEGRRFRLTPGMNVTAEVKTSRRRIIDFLVDPLRKHRDESLHER